MKIYSMIIIFNDNILHRVTIQDGHALLSLWPLIFSQLKWISSSSPLHSNCTSTSKELHFVLIRLRLKNKESLSHMNHISKFIRLMARPYIVDDVNGTFHRSASNWTCLQWLRLE